MAALAIPPRFGMRSWMRIRPLLATLACCAFMTGRARRLEALRPRSWPSSRWARRSRQALLPEFCRQPCQVQRPGFAAGTATWARIVTSGGTFVMDMDCGTSGTSVILNTTTVSVGLAMSVTAFTITGGNA